MLKFHVDIPSPFLRYVEVAQVRLAYLYPEVTWSFDAGMGRLTGACEKETKPFDELRSEVFFQIYREKILDDTLSIRQQIHKAI